MKAQKKPVIVDYLPYTDNWAEIKEWVSGLEDNFYDHFIMLPDINPEPMEWELRVKTLEGHSYPLTQDDYIIRGISGEFYPCKKDIFHKTYDLL